jgi:hypothetical protein
MSPIMTVREVSACPSWAVSSAWAALRRARVSAVAAWVAKVSAC